MSRKKLQEPEWGFMRGDGDVVVARDDRWVRMFQHVEAVSSDGRVRVRLALLPSGQYVVTGVEFMGTAEQPVDSHLIQVALGESVAKLALRFTENAVQGDDGTWRTDGYISMAEARQVTRRSPRRTLTPEFLLNEVAPVVAEAVATGEPYARLLARRFTISESTARNWKEKLDEAEAQR